LLSVTLSDFILTLFFLLLLLAAFSLLKKNKELLDSARQLGREQQKIVKLEEDLRQIADRVAFARHIMEKLPDASDKKLDRLILVAVRDAKRLAELEKLNRSLETQRVSLSDRVSQLKQQLHALTDGSAAPCLTALGVANSKLDDAAGQLRYCSERLGKSGFGKKPCWVDGAGRIEYAFAVTITEDVIRAAPSWPPGRSGAARQIPGMESLAGTWAASEFAARAALILAWSEQHDCRHFVTIRDEATSKAAFKRNLLTVEGYFYKRLLAEPDRQGIPGASAGAPPDGVSPLSP
jgi:hypothetical protein